jgi:hypothetical protein
MNRQQAEEFRQRWQAVAEIEAEEQREATIELRWRQLNAIWGLAHGLGLPTPERDEEVVRQRWIKLKEIWEQRSQNAPSL